VVILLSNYVVLPIFEKRFHLQYSILSRINDKNISIAVIQMSLIPHVDLQNDSGIFHSMIVSILSVTQAKEKGSDPVGSTGRITCSG